MKKDIKKLLSSTERKKQNQEEWRLRLALLKESSAYRSFWDEYGGEKVSKAHERIDVFYKKYDDSNDINNEQIDVLESECGEELSILNRFNGILREEFGIDIGGYLPCFRRQEWLDRLNPYKCNDQAIVAFYYPLPAISQVYDPLNPECPEEHHFITPLPSRDRKNELKPSERLLRIDLSRKRSELIKEFILFLDLVEAFRTGEDVPKKWKLNYKTWEPDNSRFRSENWKALKVWRLRRERKNYKEIANILGIEVSAAKMAFRRAYMLIEGKDYNSETFKRENLPVTVSELSMTCETCPIQTTCTELCPDMLLYVNQDHIPLRELLPGSNLEELIK